MSPEVLKNLDRVLWPLAVAVGQAGSLLCRLRAQDTRAAILRPGGMGDLILLCVAVEELGHNPREFFWIIERRSAVWADHLGLEYVCYDSGVLRQHLRVAGRFPLVINSEQRFGLSQATAWLACGRKSNLTCFDTNRAAAGARRVEYDPDGTHESVAFESLLAAALNVPARNRPGAPVRLRRTPASEAPVAGIGGSGSPSRSFSDEQWFGFLKSWAGKRPFWLVSAPSDRLLARNLQARFAGQAEVFTGSFDEVCQLVRRSEEVFTIDSGFLHIASYYGVPATVVFTSGRERKWGAMASGSRIIRRRDLECQPCTWFGQVPPCPRNFTCKTVDFGS